MKCTVCDGRGYFPVSNIAAKVCPQCNGTGEIEQTNEEWFCGLSTEEKAETIANATYSSAMMGEEITALPKEDEVRKWKMWLKAPHDWKLWLKKLHGGDGE